MGVLRDEGRVRVVWIDQMLPREEVVPLLSAAHVFACRSVYEPFGLVNLEAMACATAVVASEVGGIPEVVVDGETGLLVPLEPGLKQRSGRPPEPGASEAPADPSAFAGAFAERVAALLNDRDRAAVMGARGRERVLARFSWDAVAERTAALYRRLVG